MSRPFCQAPTRSCGRPRLRYWIVDPRDETITVLALPEGRTVYDEEAVVKAAWTRDFPYPLTVDPADVF